MPGQTIRNEVVRALKSIGLEVYPVMVFYLLYLGVIGLGNVMPYSSLSMFQTGMVMLFTSPFSYLEAVGKTPAETTEGLLNNLFVPAVMMLMVMLYKVLSNIPFSHRLRPYISVPSVFGAGVIATYVISDVVWKLTPLPSTGTSIVGFCTAVALAGAAFSDLFESRRRRGDPRPKMKEILGVILASIMGALAIAVMILGYLWMNPSWWLHLLGLGAFSILLYCWSYIGRPSLRRLPKALLAENARGILFTLVIVVVVLIV